jgi:opacity protein-like surface antigen
MKKTVAALAICGLTVPAVSFAQANNFAGFAIGLDASFTSVGGKISDTGVPGYESVDLGGRSTVVPSISVEYNLPLSQSSLIGFGIAADLSKAKLGTSQTVFYDEETEAVAIAGAKAKQKNHYSYYLKPQYLISNSTAIYAKLSYHTMKVDFDFDIIDGGGLSSGSDKTKHKGWGLGVGLKTQLSGNVFGFVEVQQVQYNKKDDFKPKSTIGSAGIQVHF